MSDCHFELGTHRPASGEPVSASRSVRFTGSGINPMRVLGAVAFESDAWWESNGHALWIWLAGPLLASFVGPLTYLSLYGTVKPGSAGKVARTEPAAPAAEQPSAEMIDRAAAGNSSSF